MINKFRCLYYYNCVCSCRSGDQVPTLRGQKPFAVDTAGLDMASADGNFKGSEGIRC